MLRQPHPGWERSEGILITKESHTILKLRSTPVMQSDSAQKTETGRVRVSHSDRSLSVVLYSLLSALSLQQSA